MKYQPLFDVDQTRADDGHLGKQRASARTISAGFSHAVLE
jgi:hypothetical protein